MRPSLFVLFFLFVIAILACRNNSSSEAAATEAGRPDAHSQAPEQESPVFLYLVNVDNLMLREKPGKSGGAVSRLREGSFVLGTGEVSDTKEEATLRGVFYKEPYRAVATMLPPVKNGWAFGGGLTCLYSGSRNDLPELSKLSQFSAFLRSLDVGKMDSGGKAWDFVQQNYSGAAGPLADAIFIMLEMFMNRLETAPSLYIEMEQFPWKDKDIEEIYKRSFDLEKYPLTARLARNGFTLDAGEGMVFPVVDPGAYKSFFWSRCSPAMQVYIALRYEEFVEKAFEDAGITVPIETIIDRAAAWERYNENYPDSPLSERTAESGRFYLLCALLGTSNSPAFDYQDRKVYPEFKNAWKYGMDEYKGADLARKIESLYLACEKNQWILTPELENKALKMAGAEVGEFR